MSISKHAAWHGQVDCRRKLKSWDQDASMTSGHISNYYDSILLVYGSSQRLNRIFSDCSNCDHFLSKRELQKGLEKHVRYIWVCLLCEWGINLDVLDISSWVRVLFGQFQALWLAAWFIQARHTLVGLRSESGKWDSTWLPKLVWSGTS